MRKCLMLCAVALAAAASAEDKLGFSKKVLVTRGELCALRLAAAWQNRGWSLEQPKARFVFRYDEKLDNVFVQLTQPRPAIDPVELGRLKQRSGLTDEQLSNVIAQQQARLPEMQRDVAKMSLGTVKLQFSTLQIETDACVRTPVFTLSWQEAPNVEVARLDNDQVTFAPDPGAGSPVYPRE